MPIVNIVVGPQNATIAQDESRQYKAFAVDNKGQIAEVTALAVWTSLDPAVATVDPAGLVTGVTAGVTTVQAAYDGKTGGVPVAVEVTLVSMTITPADVTLESGAEQPFTVTGMYSDASLEDLTVPAAFTSSSPAVATVDNMGLARAVGPGTTVIEARYGSMVAATSLGVTQSVNADLHALLAAAKAQMIRYASGQAVVALETPQLGRVVYSETNIAQLQALIDRLTLLLYPELSYMIRRRPVSVEGCP